MATLNNKAVIAYQYQGLNLQVDSNIVPFQVVNNVVTLLKSVTPAAGISGSALVYTVTVTTTAAVTNAVITDLIPTGLTFVAGSVKIDGVAQPSASPATGIAVGAIPTGTSKYVTFSCTVD